jgi:hypothetical protein
MMPICLIPRVHDQNNKYPLDSKKSVKYYQQEKNLPFNDFLSSTGDWAQGLANARNNTLPLSYTSSSQGHSLDNSG